MRKPRLIFSLLVAVVGLVTAGPALAETPTAYVRGILEKAMAIQNNQSLTEASRRPLIHKLIAQSFDFPMMARDSLGGAYGSLNSGQRQEFTNAFSHLFQDSYTRLVLNFLKRENVEYHKETLENSKARVATTIVRTNESIPVTYLMHSTPQGWILFDVIVDGVSILQNYRTEFGRVVRTKSFAFLLDKMRTQVKAIR
jgi:phospholipid transport system substrate-binding protein